MNKRLWYFLLFTIFLAVFISPLASSAPDGLERVALDLGFINLEKEASYEIFPDYSISFIKADYVSTALSGLLGLLLIGFLVWGNTWMKRRKSSLRK